MGCNRALHDGSTFHLMLTPLFVPEKNSIGYLLGPSFKFLVSSFIKSDSTVSAYSTGSTKHP